MIVCLYLTTSSFFRIFFHLFWLLVWQWIFLMNSIGKSIIHITSENMWRRKHLWFLFVVFLAPASYSRTPAALGIGCCFFFSFDANRTHMNYASFFGNLSDFRQTDSWLGVLTFGHHDNSIAFNASFLFEIYDTLGKSRKTNGAVQTTVFIVTQGIQIFSLFVLSIANTNNSNPISEYVICKI